VDRRHPFRHRRAANRVRAGCHNRSNKCRNHQYSLSIYPAGWIATPAMPPDIQSGN
jgi:hypothetical protein